MKYDININSYIGYPISKEYIAGKLKECKGKPCAVRINSYGGSVMHALDIRQQFIDHGDVTCYVYGMTASAATILTMGAKKIVMSRYAMALIHQCSGHVFEWDSMNAEQMKALIEKYRKQLVDLETIDGVIANIYSARCKRKVKEVAGTMAKAAWLTADECLAFGLIDEIMEDGEKADITDEMKERFAACGLPLPVERQAPARTADEVLEETNGLLKGIRSFFARLKNEDFSSNCKKIVDSEMKECKFKEVNAALSIDGIDMAGGKAALTGEQLKALDDKLAAAVAAESKHTAELEALRAQIDALEKGDGDETGMVAGTDDGDAGGYSAKTSAWEINKTLFNL